MNAYHTAAMARKDARYTFRQSGKESGLMLAMAAAVNTAARTRFAPTPCRSLRSILLFAVSEADTLMLKDDAKSAIDFLRTIPQIGKVGILGHSEGGTIALLLGADKVPDFIVSLAGMAVSGKETILKQNSRHLDSAGLPDDAKANSIAIIGKVLDLCAQQARDGVSTPIDIDSLIATSEAEIPAPIIASLKSTQKVRTPWFDTVLTIDPRPILPSITCPVLALNGDKDTQVDASTNIQAIRAALPQAQTHILPTLNHLLQHATTGEVTEYSEIRETISPQVLHLILAFITQQS